MRIYPKIVPYVEKKVVEEIESIEVIEEEVAVEEEIIPATPKKAKKKNSLLEENIED